MRIRIITAILALASVAGIGRSALAVGGGEVNPLLSGSYCDDGCDECDAGGRRHGCHHGHRHYYEGCEEGFNCGCNGSYKYPVPPLYTYHWPGMWSHQLMTDYHSPWRFPPLKPYTEEAPLTPISKTRSLSKLRQVSASTTTSEAESAPASFSSHLEAFGR